MSLENGQYYIYTAAGGFPIGRKLAEDRSLRPKGIFKLPEGQESVVSNLSCTACTVPLLTSFDPPLLRC